MVGTIRELIAELQQREDQEEVLLLNVWHSVDVTDVVEEREIPNWTKEDTKAVMVELESIDCNIGINWESISVVIDTHLEEK